MGRHRGKQANCTLIGNKTNILADHRSYKYGFYFTDPQTETATHIPDLKKPLEKKSLIKITFVALNTLSSTGPLMMTDETHLIQLSDARRQGSA